MFILGIDPGSKFTGFGIVNYENQSCFYVLSGVIIAQHKGAEGLATIQKEVKLIIEKYKIDTVAIERVFMRVDSRANPHAAIVLGQARGAILSACGLQGLTLHEYTANQVKKTVAGHGHATKAQVSYMVCERLGITLNTKDDASDALAIAMCHAYHCA